MLAGRLLQPLTLLGSRRKEEGPHGAWLAARPAPAPVPAERLNPVPSLRGQKRSEGAVLAYARRVGERPGSKAASHEGFSALKA